MGGSKGVPRRRKGDPESRAPVDLQVVPVALGPEGAVPSAGPPVAVDPDPNPTPEGSTRVPRQGHQRNRVDLGVQGRCRLCQYRRRKWGPVYCRAPGLPIK